MNNLPEIVLTPPPELDLFRWLGSIPVILDYLSDDEFFSIVGGLFLLAAAFLIFYALSRGERA